MLGLIALASKLLPIASAVPDVLRAFGGDKQADTADKLISTAKAITGQSDGEVAVEAIIKDPALQLQYQQALIAERVKYQELSYQDKQAAHKEQQDTIRAGDKAEDEYVRHTRPMMARQSWYGTAIYVLVMEILKAASYGTGADWQIALVLMSPAAAYLGFRTGDKFAQAWRERATKA